MSFIEQRFPPNVSRGAKGGPRLNTLVVASASGYEQRIAQWSAELRSWDVSHALRANASRDELIAFFLSMEGKANTFRFKDWSDYQSGVAAMEAIDSTHYQLRKAYALGATTRYRTLTKIAESDSGTVGDTSASPSESSVTVYESDGVTEITSGWTVDLTTGIVTFDSPPTDPMASCEFDVPARFDTDAMVWSQDEVSFGGWLGINVVEVRV
jgi:uncharacterized protein (TIGR02217 family)